MDNMKGCIKILFEVVALWGKRRCHDAKAEALEERQARPYYILKGTARLRIETLFTGLREYKFKYKT